MMKFLVNFLILYTLKPVKSAGFFVKTPTGLTTKAADSTEKNTLRLPAKILKWESF